MPISSSVSSFADDEMSIGDEQSDEVLNLDLEEQISKAMDTGFLLQLVCGLMNLLNICYILVYKLTFSPFKASKNRNSF